MPRYNGKFISQKKYDEIMAAEAAGTENGVSDEQQVEAAEGDTKERRTRQADPLLAAKRALEAARKRQEKAQKKFDAVEDVTAELAAANAELEAAKVAFSEAVAAVAG